VEAFGALSSGRGCWAHESSPQSHGRSFERWWRVDAGCAEKRPFIWDSKNSLTLCQCHPRLAGKLYHKTHRRNQCTNEVDNQ
jgi:hypothetical protein